MHIVLCSFSPHQWPLAVVVLPRNRHTKVGSLACFGVLQKNKRTMLTFGNAVVCFTFLTKPKQCWKTLCSKMTVNQFQYEIPSFLCQHVVCNVCRFSLRIRLFFTFLCIPALIYSPSVKCLPIYAILKGMMPKFSGAVDPSPSWKIQKELTFLAAIKWMTPNLVS